MVKGITANLLRGCQALEETRGAVQHGSSKVYCNGCGREINTGGQEREDYLRVNKSWGYFSHWDLTNQAFNLCQDCYERLIAQFKIPVEEYVVEELPMYTEAQLEALNEAYAKELSK